MSTILRRIVSVLRAADPLQEGWSHTQMFMDQARLTVLEVHFSEGDGRESIKKSYIVDPKILASLLQQKLVAARLSDRDMSVQYTFTDKAFDRLRKT